MSCFSFLGGDWTEAAKTAQQAEDILFIDQIAAITHVGTYCHMITEILFKKEQLGDSDRKTQMEKLTILYEKQIIPPNINGMFHDIRMARNRAVYEGEAGIGRALLMLQQAYEISVWAYTRYSDPKFKAAGFLIPPGNSKEQSFFKPAEKLSVLEVENGSLVKLTLHEAMSIVLSKAVDKKMHMNELADKIYGLELYKKKDGQKASNKQILLRAKKYNHLFNVSDKYIELIDY